MSVVLVTGGARSGKSKFAENIYSGIDDVVYIATSRAEDIEMEERILKHRKSRPNSWRTFEGSYNLFDAIGSEKNYLLDCIAVLTSNIMFDLSKNEDRISQKLQGEIEDRVVNELKELINKVFDKGFNLVMVTNEVGDSIVPENHIARVYRDILGRVNQRAAELSKDVYLLCCGLPIKIK